MYCRNKLKIYQTYALHFSGFNIDYAHDKEAKVHLLYPYQSTELTAQMRHKFERTFFVILMLEVNVFW